MASGFSHKSVIESSSLDLPDKRLNINWEDVICPICLDFPHNGVLLQCSSCDKGCRPFMCDTDHTHSNCLDRFKSAYGLPADTKVSSTVTGTSAVNVRASPSETGSCPICPLCRGEVTGWIVIDEARAYLDTKKRCCQEKQCSYVGNYMELQLHAKQEHPHARPSEIDPAQQLDWENLQHSSEIIDVLSTIDSEIPHGVVLGDYVIEYGDAGGHEYEDFPGDDGNWWASCILYHVFDNFRTSRNRRRSRASETRRNHHRSNYDVSSMDDASISSADNLEYHFDDSDDDFGGAVGVTSRERAYGRSYRRRRSRFQDS
ncbi:uncharacterized protein LOC103696172 isoform X2 [Phoenix dactylifera]|uniref:Uncharacterized protein LOC103696172 isoform X1 n=1 Tax=Phoenix dactylifera TaxID=42345 RepID=A0A8B8J0B9_PHODC|nr:uncharacterized protein LOC103696172 isoform X1 [Phoenix dactylifera]XP_026656595.1 uncharacterized protein LOC103696172 isoform X2 [Phoenix dactylifera]